MISVRLQGKPFNITVIQVYDPTSNTEETEVERFYEDLQDLLELTPKKDVLCIWNSSTLATSCEELTHWKSLWCWEGLGPGGEGDDRRWDGCMASLTQWTWVWVNSRSWWWTGRPGMLWFMGSQRVRHDWATQLNCCRMKLERIKELTLWIYWLPITFILGSEGRPSYYGCEDRRWENELMVCPGRVKDDLKLSECSW